MILHFEVHGDGSPVVILHGLLGSADNWRTISRLLGAHYRVFAVDLRNHGRSPHSDEFDFEGMADDVRNFVDRENLRDVMLLGHSVGGKVAMRFALDHPHRVERLVVVDIAPKAYEPSQRELLETLCSLDLKPCKSFGDVDKAMAATIADPVLRGFLIKNLARNRHGRLVWKIHLAAIRRNYDKLVRGLASERPFDKPTLFVRGGRSRYIEDSDAPAIRQMFPRSEIATLADAGHWVHADLPEEFHQTVLDFLGKP